MNDPQNTSTLEFLSHRTEIAGVSVAQLASDFGTPTYVYDLSIVARRIADLECFDVIRYAQKANSTLAVLDFVRQQGVKVDAVSAGEIVRAMKVGYRPGQESHEIVYTADIFDRPALELVIAHDIHCNMGSPDMIDQYGERMPDRPITLRINPGFGHGHSQKTNTGGPQSKHGIWHEQVSDCFARAAKYGLSVTGLHMHIGSGTDLEHLSQVCDAMESVARQHKAPLKTISAGGGLPIAYQPGQDEINLKQYYDLWDGTRQRLQNDVGQAIELEIEPGRYLVAESGFLITEIRAIKKMGENTFYLVDAGFNNLARPILYGAHHPISICSLSNPDSKDFHDVIVGGPLCESGDIFTQEEGGFVSSRSLPQAHVGDLLILERAGAYGFVMSSNYNSKPFAAEVVIRDHESFLARRRQSEEAVLQGESIPW
jgi:diaminopimelate decarboxylase